jgi:hypothetical protein
MPMLTKSGLSEPEPLQIGRSCLASCLSAADLRRRQNETMGKNATLACWGARNAHPRHQGSSASLWRSDRSSAQSSLSSSPGTTCVGSRITRGG